MTDYFFLELLEQKPVVFNKCNTPEFKHAKGIAWRSLLKSLQERGQIFTESQLRRKWVNLKARALEKYRKRGGPESGLLSRNDTKVLELLGICGKFKTPFTDTDDASCSKSDSGTDEKKRTSRLIKAKREAEENFTDSLQATEETESLTNQGIKTDSIETSNVKDNDEQAINTPPEDDISVDIDFLSQPVVNSVIPAASPQPTIQNPLLEEITSPRMSPNRKTKSRGSAAAVNSRYSAVTRKKSIGRVATHDKGFSEFREVLDIKRRRLTLDEEKLRTNQLVLEELREIRHVLGQRSELSQELSSECAASNLNKTVQLNGINDSQMSDIHGEISSMNGEDGFSQIPSWYDAEGYIKESQSRLMSSEDIAVKLEPSIDPDTSTSAPRTEAELLATDGITFLNDDSEPPPKRHKTNQLGGESADAHFNISQHVIRLRTTCFGALTDLTNHVAQVSSLNILDSVLETVEELTKLCKVPALPSMSALQNHNSLTSPNLRVPRGKSPDMDDMTTSKPSSVHSTKTNNGGGSNHTEQSQNITSRLSSSVTVNKETSSTVACCNDEMNNDSSKLRQTSSETTSNFQIEAVFDNSADNITALNNENATEDDLLSSPQTNTSEKQPVNAVSSSAAKTSEDQVMSSVGISDGASSSAVSPEGLFDKDLVSSLFEEPLY